MTSSRIPSSKVCDKTGKERTKTHHLLFVDVAGIQESVILEDEARRAQELVSVFSAAEQYV